MVAIKVRKLVAHMDFTHSLIIKLHSSSLLPQLETSLQRFRKDALAAGIRKRAFVPTGNAGLSLGRLLLKTPQRREDFSKFLHSIDYRKLLGPTPESAQISSAATEQVDTAHSRSHVAPLRINFSGLVTLAPNPSKSVELSLLAVDPTGRLQPFWSSLIDCFTVAGFPILRPSPDLRWQFVSSFIVDRDSYDVIDNPNGGTFYKGGRRLLRFDARDLLKKYENAIWAKDVPLERLSLCGIGASEKNPDGEIVMKLKPEIDSVALHDDRDLGSYSHND